MVACCARRVRTPEEISSVRRRASIKPLIGHLKHDQRMLENNLWGRESGTINAMLAATAWNIKKLMKELLHILMQILFGSPILSAMCAENTFIKERLVKNYISELLLIEIYLHLLVKGITRCNEYRVILLIEGFRSN